MGDKLSEKIVTSACVSALFGLTLFFFGPTHLYFTNILEYSSSFSALCPFLIGISLLPVLFFTPLLPLIRDSLFQKVISIFFILSLLLWLQGNVLVWKYGELDGREIDWAAKAVYGLIDGTIWILLLIVAVKASARIRRIAAKGSIALVLIQVISTLLVVSRAPNVSHIHQKSAPDTESFFLFSKERNVLVLILDSFQSDVFQEIINETPHYRDLFEGFTYYRNALSGYPVTYANIPLILTGRFYENSVPVQDFVKSAFSSASIPKLLTEHGYRVDLADIGKYIYTDQEIAASRVPIKQLIDQDMTVRDLTLILDVTLFRYLPHFAKRYVYNNQSWFLQNLGFERAFGGFPTGDLRDSIEFMQKMAREAKAGNNTSTFKYVHLWPPHLPVRMNERVEYEDMQGTRENYKKQAKGTLQLTGEIFDRLKKIGVYDDTMIFVIADHGSHFPVDPEMAGYNSDDAESKAIEDIKPTAIPLFLVKPFKSSGKMKISDAPVSLSDIARTIVAELKLDTDIPGESVFDIGESDVRNRRYLYHEWGQAWPGDYFAPIDEYIVTGFSWLDESWHPTSKRFMPKTAEHPVDARGSEGSSGRYAWGSLIQFGIGGNAAEYQDKGWSTPEPGFTWTVGHRASLKLRIGQSGSDILLRATLSPFIVPGRLEHQAVDILVNDERVGTWVVEGKSTLWNRIIRKGSFQVKTVSIPQALTKNATMKITFELPDAMSPAKAGVTGDSRILGIAVRSIVLSETAR